MSDRKSSPRSLLVLLARTGLFDRSRFPAADSQTIQAQIKDFDAITASTPSVTLLSFTSGVLPTVSTILL